MRNDAVFSFVNDAHAVKVELRVKREYLGGRAAFGNAKVSKTSTVENDEYFTPSVERFEDVSDAIAKYCAMIAQSINETV